MRKSELKIWYKENNNKRKLYLGEYRKKMKKTHTFKHLALNMNYLYKSNSLTAIDLWKVAKKQRLICPLTNDKLTYENVSVDHIIPKSKGGLNIPSNIRLVTKRVNIARGSMTDNELIELCQKIIKTTGGTPLTI